MVAGLKGQCKGSRMNEGKRWQGCRQGEERFGLEWTEGENKACFCPKSPVYSPLHLCTISTLLVPLLFNPSERWLPGGAIFEAAPGGSSLLTDSDTAGWP